MNYQPQPQNVGYYPPQPQYPAYPPQQTTAPVQQPYPQAPAAPYPPQQYGGYPAPQAPPAQPLANGTIDDYYAQPTGGGPGVSWKGKPDGYWVQGIVPRDVADGDVTQEVGAPNTQDAGRPQFFRDGRPKLVMAVPLQMQPSAEYPDGEVRLFIRGQLREELSRAMAEAGVTYRAPKAGDVITVTLVQRKQGRGTIPQNIFAVHYQSAHGGQPVAPPTPAPVPVQQAPVQQYAPQAPVQQMAPAPQAPVQQPVAQQQAPVPPPTMTAEQAELLARLTGGAPQA